MKVSAIISAAFLGAVPLLALADASDDEHGFRIETTEQAAAAMSAPLFFNPMVPSVGEALPFFAAQSAEKLRSAAAAINPDFGASIPPTDIPCPDGGFFTLQAAPDTEWVLQAQYQGCRAVNAGTTAMNEINGSVVASFGADNRITRVRFSTPDPYTEGVIETTTNFLAFLATVRMDVNGLLIDTNPPAVQSFLHRIDGSFVQDSFFPPDSPQAPAARFSSSVTTEGVVYSGTFFFGPDANGNFIFGRDGTLQGSITSRSLVVDQAGNTLVDANSAVRSTGIAVVDKTAPDPQTGAQIRTLAWNGDLGLDYGGFAPGPGCLNGDYEIQTEKPILAIFASGGGPLNATEGRLRINNRAETVFNADQTVTLKFKGPMQFQNFVSLQDFSGCGVFLQ